MNDHDAHKTKFHSLLQEQVFHEFTNSQQYIAIAVYFDGADLRQLAKHFYGQAVEERNHAMMLVQYLLDRDVRVEIPRVDGVRNTFDTPHDALALALDQERGVTEQVTRLAWALQGSPAELTVPIGQFTSTNSGAVVMWDHDKATALFDALAADQPVPAGVLGQ